jgi:hypothetical protein
MDRALLLKAELLLDRLERISADSPWAHQASGIRASLARHISRVEPDIQAIQALMESGFQVLENAAGEIPDSPRSESG